MSLATSGAFNGFGTFRTGRDVNNTHSRNKRLRLREGGLKTGGLDAVCTSSVGCSEDELVERGRGVSTCGVSAESGDSGDVGGSVSPTFSDAVVEVS